jgi:hypothetical protein
MKETLCIELVNGHDAAGHPFGHIYHEGVSGGWFFTWGATPEETLASVEPDEVEGTGIYTQQEARRVLEEVLATNPVPTAETVTMEETTTSYKPTPPPGIYMIEAFGVNEPPIFASRDECELFLAACVAAWPEGAPARAAYGWDWSKERATHTYRDGRLEETRTH